MPDTKAVSLDALVNPSLSVELRGKVYPVAPLDGFAQQLSRNVRDKNEAIDVMYKIAARCLAPRMSYEEVFGSETVIGLTPDQVSKVVEVAASQIDDVEATIPNDGKAGAAKDGSNPSSPPESHQPIQLAS